MHARLLAMSAAVLIGGCTASGLNQSPLNESTLTPYGIEPGEITPADIMAEAQFGPTYAAALHNAADTMLVSDALPLTPEQVRRTGMPADITVGDWRALQTVAWRIQHGLPADGPGVNVDFHPPVRL